MGILDIIGAVASGGVTGILGAGMQLLFGWLAKREERAVQKDKFSHELDMKRADAEIMAQEWAARGKIAITEADAAKDVAASQAFAASFNLEPKRYAEGVKPGKIGGTLLIFIDVFRGSIRPGLTVYLCWLTTLVYFQARMLLSKEDLDVVQAMEITHQIITTILYLTTTCVLWWFGTRVSEVMIKKTS